MLDTTSASSYNHSMIEKMIRVGRLYDIYGALLTDRQRKCLELHYMQDLSLGEIADEFGVSRQAINDILRRTEESLEQYEQKLALLAKEMKRAELLKGLKSTLTEALDARALSYVSVRQALDTVDLILKEEMGY